MSDKKSKMKGPKLIGLTGSIGSGKSTVAKIFASLGIPIYDSDVEAKLLMRNDEKLKARISDLFGNDIYLPNGELDRAKLADIVFSDPHKLQKLNRLVHPAVKIHFQSWVLTHSSAPYVIKEAAILFESKANKGLDKTICVTAPMAIRHQRVVNRDGVSIEKVVARESNQWKESEKARQSHFILVNDGEHSLIEQIMGIHECIVNENSDK